MRAPFVSILEVMQLPEPGRARACELINERSKLIGQAPVLLEVGMLVSEEQLRVLVRIREIDEQLNELIARHRNGTLHKWATASPEGLLCDSSES
jgi:hypothetical protein